MKKLQEYKVSDRLPVREWVPTQVQVCLYAEASGDFNPIHLDDTYARQAGLGGVIAHGMLTMAQMADMITEWISTEGIISNLEVRFEQMVRPGDTIKFYGFVNARLENSLICNIEAVNAQMERVLSGSTSITIIL